MQMGAEMTNQKLGRATNDETLPPISVEASPSLPKKARGKVENESSYRAGKAAGVGRTTVEAAKRVLMHAPDLAKAVERGHKNEKPFPPISEERVSCPERACDPIVCAVSKARVGRYSDVHRQGSLTPD